MTTHKEPENLRSHSTARTMPASVNQVFDTFKNPEHLANWWGPAGFTNTFHKMDFFKGGLWQFTMHGPDGKNYENECLFVDIVPNEKIVIEHLPPPHFFLTLTFKEQGDTTLVSWCQLFDTIAQFQKVSAIVCVANEQNLDKYANEINKRSNM